jgi:serine/threonine-protein kinase SRPK3
LANSQNAAKVNQDLFYGGAAPPQDTIEPEV